MGAWAAQGQELEALSALMGGVEAAAALRPLAEAAGIERCPFLHEHWPELEGAGPSRKPVGLEGWMSEGARALCGVTGDDGLVAALGDGRRGGIQRHAREHLRDARAREFALIVLGAVPPERRADTLRAAIGAEGCPLLERFSAAEPLSRETARADVERMCHAIERAGSGPPAAPFSALDHHAKVATVAWLEANLVDFFGHELLMAFSKWSPASGNEIVRSAAQGAGLSSCPLVGWGG
jgi:hypothetical protein